ncbi:hypothetical protein [Motilimonas eburnea]|uniref:hypothetical protein n=1 Tax=Motilimonas eburnea TaxID=1737488 RepID=UPI001E5C2269|nr:hypothetical protein [Motilimonas eburnea]MCE2573929.1 hypothetical protein [Motilimonas eburnea]
MSTHAVALTDIAPWELKFSVYKFNRDTIPVILKFMGNNLLDWNVHINKGVGNWHFYVGNKLIAGACVGDDTLVINDPSELIINKLNQMGIPYEWADT